MEFTYEEIRRRAWISQLYQEYALICWQYDVSLRRPIIEVIDSERLWGRWDPNHRTIGITGRLIEEHTWDVVLNVLKHEMAHQIVTDLFNAADRHGEAFLKACAMIGVPPEFQERSGDIPRIIPDLRDRQFGGENGKVLEKVGKLLALARSRNEHEAALAMRKANELIKKYNLERIGQSRESDYVYRIIDQKRKRIDNFQRRILSLLSDFYFVKVVHTSRYDASDGETYRVFELLGTAENVLMAEYVYYFLYNQLKVLWDDYRSRNGSPVKHKNSYRLGVLKGFREKLEEMEVSKDTGRSGDINHNGETTCALILAGDGLLKKFVGSRFPRLSKYTPRATSIHTGIFQAGINDGKQLKIHKGIVEKDGNQGRLLTG